MKKIFLITGVIFILTSNISAQLRAGITAGPVLSNMLVKVDGESEDGDNKLGVAAGLFVDIPFGRHLSFQPSLNFVKKGTQDESYGDKIQLTLNYFEIPLNLLYNSRGTNGNFFIGGGPAIGMASSGKWKYEFNGNSYDEDVKFGNDEEDDLKKVELSLNSMGGFQTKGGILFSINYNHGISNLMPGGSAEGKVHTNYVGIRLGYIFKPRMKIKSNPHN